MNAFRTLWQATNKRVVFMTGLIVSVWLIFNGLSGGYILKPENMANLFSQVTVVAILATAMTLVIVQGNIDLSVGSMLGMFGALMATMATDLAWNSYASVAMILALGFAVGCFHGALIYYFNIPAFVVTLGGLIAYRGVTQYLARKSIPVSTPWIKAIVQKSLPPSASIVLLALIIAAIFLLMALSRRSHAKNGLRVNPLWVDVVKCTVMSLTLSSLVMVMVVAGGIPMRVVIMLVIAVCVSILARFTRFGRYVYAIGGNRQAALYSGISIARNTVLLFGLMGLIASIAGVIQVAELYSAAPDIGDLKELECIAACVIGGTSLAGGSGAIGMSVLGALIMASIKNGMSMMGIVAQMQKVILGSLLVLAVALDQWSRRARKAG